MKEGLRKIPENIAKKTVGPALAVTLLFTGCKGLIVNNLHVNVTPTPSAAAGIPTPGQTEPPTPTTPGPGEIPIATPTSTGSSGAGEKKCDVLAITSLPARPSAHVNEIGVRLEVRDKNDCERPLFYSETGVGKGQNYTLDLPKGWSVITASISATVHRKGGKQKDYTDTPVVVINGPFEGGVGVFEGSLSIGPTEWAGRMAEKRLGIQREQTEKSSLQITVVEDN